MKKIQQYALALGLSAMALIGCAPKNYATVGEAMKVLKVRDSGMIHVNLPNGYKTLITLDGKLRSLAGIYAGTVDVKKIKNGYAAQGSYSQAEHPEAMERVLSDVDVNGDKIVTRQEIKDLTDRVYRERAR